MWWFLRTAVARIVAWSRSYWWLIVTIIGTFVGAFIAIGAFKDRKGTTGEAFVDEIEAESTIRILDDLNKQLNKVRDPIDKEYLDISRKIRTNKELLKSVRLDSGVPMDEVIKEFQELGY